MGEKDKPDKTGESDGSSSKRIDVSFAQVAGSAVAAVIAALLAGRMGVYGTFIGAGVVSVVATTGGPLFQHFFSRTGEQIKDKTVQAQPRVRKVTLRERTTGKRGGKVVTTVEARPEATAPVPAPVPGDDATRLLPRAVPGARGAEQDDRTRQLRPGAISQGDTERTQLLASSDVTQLLRTAEDPDRTRKLTAAGTGNGTGAQDGTGAGDPSGDGEADVVLPAEDEEFTEGTTHGTRWRGWRRTLIPTVIVFAVAIGGITLYEVITQNNVSGGKGTSISNLFHSGSSQGADEDGERSTDPAPRPEQSGPTGEPTPETGTDGGGATQDPGTGTQQPGTGTGTGDDGGTGDGSSPQPGTGGTPAPGTGGEQGTGGEDGSGTETGTGGDTETGDPSETGGETEGADGQFDDQKQPAPSES
ncbi:hypothetical protein [Streptomyces sp. HNM0574]|uniref:hypothetical protein n=1 Tax=Streptomyces sp. HNM0574 TaxID=2714954 RepID=UPI00146A533F|nr:hypothetical protein [Streptomyces sp. HNM0574]NLU65751.1 hypothetical protein [Streptomyces sp. HNM0574]